MISGLALAIAVYMIVILTLTEPHDNIQILLVLSFADGDYIYSSFGYPSCCGNTGQVHQHLLTMTAEVAPSLH